MNDILKKYHLSADKCLFIGDAMADYEAAHKNNVNFLAIKIPSCKTEFPQNTLIKDTVRL